MSSAWLTRNTAGTVARIVVSCVVAMVVAVGCSGGSSDSHGDVITVSAAASLTDAFDRIIAGFEADHDDVEVQVNYGSSGELAEQVANGAPVDVVAFADHDSMERLVQEDLVGPVHTFATNSMVMVTKPGNPMGISALTDLTSPDVGVVSLCRIEAPCGRYARDVLDAAGVELERSRVSWGRDVRATLGAVTNGDAAAGIVYRTDALAVRDRVAVVDIPDGLNIRAEYPIAVVDRRQRDGNGGAARPADRDPAEQFVSYVLGDRAGAVLEEFGFGRP